MAQPVPPCVPGLILGIVQLDHEILMVPFKGSHIVLVFLKVPYKIDDPFGIRSAVNIITEEIQLIITAGPDQFGNKAFKSLRTTMNVGDYPALWHLISSFPGWRLLP